MSKSRIKVSTSVGEDKDYVETFVALKAHIQATQVKAVLAANRELIKLYWEIGEIISKKQKESGWGSGVIERLANDLQKEFPGLNGFSRTNIFRIQAFYEAYEKVAQPVRQILELPVFNIPFNVTRRAY